jgi:dTDP-4-dehydrorhamnose reductase
MIFLTGGTGLLGTELRKHLSFWAPTRKELNILNPEINIPYDINLIVHCAAYTDVVGAEMNKQECYDTNVIGTRNLARLGIPMLYISTEYVFDGTKGNYSETDYPNPQNFYALTKLLGEYEARKAVGSVILRCLFKPRPFEHDAALSDQFTSGNYVDVIAKDVVHAINIFDSLPQTIHIGDKKKSTYELAKETKPNIIPLTIENLEKQLGGRLRFPKDTSLNTTLWESLK